MSAARGAAAALCLAAALCTGCERKLPGPRECELFALHALGVTNQAELARPQVKDAVDALTVRCLTTPFSRSLIRCVEEGGGARACFAQFGPRGGAAVELR